MLLLLDNFEHLISAASVIADLLSVTSRLKIVVTSRAPLHVYGEREFPVPPLELPHGKSVPSLNALAHLPAIQLFVERAQAVRASFELTKENASTIAAVCARLDGLPLAIELAAARVKLLSPHAMLARLETCLDLLTGGARDLPARQQTLRGTVEWSFCLLNAAEQVLFRRLSVFVGGCTLEGVEAVCDTGGDLGLDVLDGMASMVDKSLIQRIDQTNGEARFVMLSTIREYALERLAESGDEPATRRAHAAYHLVLAEEGAKDALAPEWLNRFELDRDNLRVAFDHLIATSQAEWGLRLGAAVFRFWDVREHFTEGREVMARLLELQESHSHPKLRARVLFAAAVLADEQGDFESAQQLFEQSLDTCLELNDQRGIAVALNALAVNARERSDLGTSAVLFERCVSIWRGIGDAGDVARALSNFANSMKLQGEYERADSLYNECRDLFLQGGDGAGVAWTLNYQGDVARRKGDVLAAQSFCQDSLAAFRRLQDQWGMASALTDLATLYRDRGDFRNTCQHFLESIRKFQSLGHKRGIARVLEGLAATAILQLDFEHSLRLAGAAAALRQQLGAPLSSSEQSSLEQALDIARQKLGSETGMTAWMEGWTMTVEEAVEEAVNHTA
jgi:predicted ATPase